MRQISILMVLAAPLAFAACTVAPPTGPSVLALPGKDKNFAAFQQDDANCRQYAFQQGGGVQPADAATNSAVGSAVLGTALGAAAGGLIGSVTGNFGAGAAIGAGAGLLGGSAVGANNAQISAGGLQQRYDNAYTQCMYAQGNTVQAASTGYGGGSYSYGGPAYGYPGGYGEPVYGYPGYYAGPVFGPTVIVGGGFGYGGGYGHGYRRW